MLLNFFFISPLRVMSSPLSHSFFSLLFILNLFTLPLFCNSVFIQFLYMSASLQYISFILVTNFCVHSALIHPWPNLSFYHTHPCCSIYNMFFLTYQTVTSTSLDHILFCMVIFISFDISLSLLYKSLKYHQHSLTSISPK